MVDVEQGKARAKRSLGLSTLISAGAVGWFWYQGSLFTGVGLGVILVIAGYWEYTRRLTDVRQAARAEADAERRQQRDGE